MTSQPVATVASTLIGILIVALVWLCFPRITYSPCGIFLPTSEKTRAAININQVNLYKEMPLLPNKIGSISIEHHVELDDQTEEKILFDVAKKMAAEHGANGVVIKNLFRTQPTGSQAPLAAFVLYADAISLPTAR